MKQTRMLMGMPITVEIVDAFVTAQALENVFEYFISVEERFSTYREGSEISRINAGLLQLQNASADMRTVFALAEETKQLTDGYFDIRRPDGSIDPSGIVKGWAILHAAKMLERNGFRQYYVEAGGDIQVGGCSADGDDWRVGIRNPFFPGQIIKIVTIQHHGVATSGTYLRGQHIYNPHDPHAPITAIVSITVIGPDVYEADRFATAAFAMGRGGITFIESLPGFEAYMIDSAGIATMTSGFPSFVPDHAVLAR